MIDHTFTKVRVFTEAFTSPDDWLDAKRRLITRAEHVILDLNSNKKLSLEDGVFSHVYHPTTKLFVMILTITPSE